MSRLSTTTMRQRLKGITDSMHTIDLYEHSFSVLRETELAVPMAPRALYFALLDDDADLQVVNHQIVQDRSAAFLQAALRDCVTLPCDLPERPGALEAWMEQHTCRVLDQYQVYLQARQSGAARQYFSTKTHALHFLMAVAPTKTVDGAWLYGLLAHWQDDRFSALIRIYLEELGCGQPEQNHVVLYKRLLLANGCECWDHLDDKHFIQGTIQLALARHADRFLPELIGFNLGYEQLPLHLLITAYELNELGIDPTYFGLHVTVDNADTGHARQALQGLRDALPVVGDRQGFYARVLNGYQLNALGASTTSVIAEFDLEAELIAVLRRKSAAGKQAHADYCRIGGRTVNDWLSTADNIPGFVAALQSSGWIKRGQAPENSRFWKLIEGERADMFGIFSAYEKQVLRDWIVSGGPEVPQPVASTAVTGRVGARALSFKTRQKLLDHLEPPQPAAAPAHAARCSSTGERRAIARHQADRGRYDSDEADDFNAELRELTLQLAKTGDRPQAMQMLAGLMAPTRHHTHIGLQATRIFARMFGALG